MYGEGNLSSVCRPVEKPAGNTNEFLVRFLTDNDLDEPSDGKLMPTAALARLEMPDDWTQLEAGCATVLGIVRPKQLK